MPGVLSLDYTLATVALGAGVLGVVSGVLGSFAVLRKQSLLGDAISHAALPGIVLAFLLTGTKAPLVLVLGAAVAGWVATFAVMAVTGYSRVKYDSALGIVLSVFFAFGLMLLTYVQKRPDASQAGLDKFLFGQAAALLRGDVVTMAGLGVVAIVVVVLLWKELKLLSFDPGFGAALGLPLRGLDTVLTGLLVVAIVLGLQTVGVVLMSAMVVAPGAAARQWTDRLGLMVLLSALFGAASGVAGAVVSSTSGGLPTGPVIVVVASVIVVVSLTMAPGRGLVWSRLRDRVRRRQLRLGLVLADLLALSEQHTDVDHPHTEATLAAMAPDAAAVPPTLSALEERRLVRRVDGGWALTPQGRAAARRLRDEEARGAPGGGGSIADPRSRL